jgi:ribulose-phosphate 3-epimerase
MPDHNLISASILSADFGHLADEVLAAQEAGAGWIHIDVMDGHFVPNLSMGPVIIKAVRSVTQLPIDVHLMIEKPELSLPAYAQAGGDHLIVHIEACPQIHRTLQQIKNLGCKAGVALNPGTPVEFLSEILPLADIVLVMSVNPGYAGQKFIETTPAKLSRLRGACEKQDCHPIIEVDGGINAQTLPPSYEAGACAFVAASAIFKHPQGTRAGVKALLDSLPEEIWS